MFMQKRGTSEVLATGSAVSQDRGAGQGDCPGDSTPKAPPVFLEMRQQFRSQTRRPVHCVMLPIPAAETA
jgi:hypothetical protein